ncbi:MAG: hypothetical protein OEN56_06570 [Gemmatimonadota bacterium]|nr:hypothetical protein [Gemmatimonadota bacterium]
MRRLEGRGTVGDVVAASGLPADEVRSGLKALLESHRGHLEVSNSGELVYDFDPRFIERGTEPLSVRTIRAVKATLTTVFKGAIVVMLVAYFVIFVVLIIAAIVASQRGNDSRGGWGGGRRGRGGFGFDPIFWYWIWGPRWRIGRPYYGHRWERTLGEGDRVPFYKKVFAFVFGPDRPQPTQKQIDRSTLRLIRARNGVLTAAELVQHTASRFDEAEEEMARLLGSYDGEVAVSPDGTLVYAFPGLMASAQDRRPTEPNPAWLRLEPPRELTGNTTGANALVAGMNGFTLATAATAPWFLFPRLGLAGPAAFVGLVLVPLIFSVLFFAAPLLRMVGVARDNRRRARRNVRRVLLGHLYDRTLTGGEVVNERDAYTFVKERLADQVVVFSEIQALLREMATELDADPEELEDGSVQYRFGQIREQFGAADQLRRKLRLEQRSLGEIVYATSDSAEEAADRDRNLFDRALGEGDQSFDRYLPSVDRVDYEDDFELVAFDES